MEILSFIEALLVKPSTSVYVILSTLLPALSLKYSPVAYSHQSARYKCLPSLCPDVYVFECVFVLLYDD
jgi:hypothetical protein